MAHKIHSSLTKTRDIESSDDYSERETQQQLIFNLPVYDEWHMPLLYYKSFWVPLNTIECLIKLETNNFTPRTSDIFLVSIPKSGTTWLKALAFSVTNRQQYSPLTSVPHPLLNLSPHECVPFFEFSKEETNQHHNFLESSPSPRLLSTHIPYSLLPAAMTDIARFIYICRDPKDVFTSMWHFHKTFISNSERNKQPPTLNEDFKMFCNGLSANGPVWENALEYWRASQQRPDKVLFLRYEELMIDPIKVMKKMAEFMGCRFSEEEEKMGLIEELTRLCSFDKLRNLDHNKNGHVNFGIKNLLFNKSSFFRQGKVGDWVNLITPEMGKELDNITFEKCKLYLDFSF